MILILKETDFANYADDIANYAADFANYADDILIMLMTLLIMLITLPFYKTCENIDAVPETLRMSTEKLFKWFKDNQTKDSIVQFYLILSTGDSSQIQVGNSLIKGILCENSLVLYLIIN